MTMATIVVDSSVVIKWFVTEPLSEESRRVLLNLQHQMFICKMQKTQ